jgi:hypothetical protein
MKSFGPPKNPNYMQVLKSAILVIFQKGLGWPCPRIPRWISKIIFVFGSYKFPAILEGKIRKGSFF